MIGQLALAWSLAWLEVQLELHHRKERSRRSEGSGSTTRKGRVCLSCHLQPPAGVVGVPDLIAQRLPKGPQGKGSALAAKAVKTQGKGSVSATGGSENTPGEGSVSAAKAVTSHKAKAVPHRRSFEKVLSHRSRYCPFRLTTACPRIVLSCDRRRPCTTKEMIGPVRSTCVPSLWLRTIAWICSSAEISLSKTLRRGGVRTHRLHRRVFESIMPLFRLKPPMMPLFRLNPPVKRSCGSPPCNREEQQRRNREERAESREGEERRGGGEGRRAGQGRGIQGAGGG